jgi:hypothetical protein
VAAARQELEDTKLAEARGRAAMENLERWQNQSLPSNPTQAVSLYRTWLLEQLNKAGLTNDIDLKYVPRSRLSNSYQTVRFTVESKGDIGAVARFLYEFYHHDHMHKLVSLRLRPNTGGQNLIVMLDIEALIVRGAVRDDTLSDGTSDRLALADADAYRESIASRNVFQAYRAGGNESAPQPEGSDHSAETFVTHILRGANRRVWFNDRSNGRVHRLKEGDRLRVPGYFARVEEIRRHEVVISKDNELYAVSSGKNLSQGRRIKKDDDNSSADNAEEVKP